MLVAMEQIFLKAWTQFLHIAKSVLGSFRSLPNTGGSGGGECVGVVESKQLSTVANGCCGCLMVHH